MFQISVSRTFFGIAYLLKQKNLIYLWIEKQICYGGSTVTRDPESNIKVFLSSEYNANPTLIRCVAKKDMKIIVTLHNLVN